MQYTLDIQRELDRLTQAPKILKIEEVLPPAKFYYFVGLTVSKKSTIQLTENEISNQVRNFCKMLGHSYRIKEAEGEFNGKEKCLIICSTRQISTARLDLLSSPTYQESILEACKGDKILLDNSLLNFYTEYRSNKFQVVEPVFIKSSWFKNLKKGAKK